MASKSTPKARSRKQPFKQDYSKRWECIVQSRRDEYSARCTLCCSDFSIGHGGANDLHCYLPYSAFNWPKNSKCICSGVLIHVHHHVCFKLMKI